MKVLVVLSILLQGSLENSGCKLPNYPENGQWQVLGDPTDGLSPGSTVATGTVLSVSCEKGFKIVGTKLGVCEEQEIQWQTKMAHCSRTCPHLVETDKIKVTCTLKDPMTGDIAHVKCSEATDGTVAQFECTEFYTIKDTNSTEEIRSGGSGLSRCQNGTWSVQKPNCNPNCGIKSLTGVALSVQSQTAPVGTYPWQAAIYYRRGNSRSNQSEKFDFICGASLINEEVVLTAAHCVTDLDGNMEPKDHYKVAAGKYYRDLDDNRDSNFLLTNLKKVKEMFIPSRYKGSTQNLYGDIAILIVTAPFKLTSQIQPICVDWNKTYKQQFFSPMNLGYVSGWGASSEAGDVPDKLQEIELPYVPRDVCSDAISSLDQAYLTDDKICLGYVNQSKGVCAGDSGSALVFKNSFDHRYYLTGIVSVSPDRKLGNACNSQLYSLYTEVYSYIDFIREKAADYTSASKFLTYILAEKFKNGKWEILESNQSSIKESEQGTVVAFKCIEGYVLHGMEQNVWKDDKWQHDLPSCLKTCPALNTSSLLSCARKVDKEWLPIDCNQATDGTVATMQCETKIGMSKNGSVYYNRAYSVCNGEKWSSHDGCNQQCGNGNENDYPWKAAIYNSQPVPHFVCTGVLVAERIILTVASCIADVEPFENLRATVGNHYWNFNDSRDGGKTQILKIVEKHFPNAFNKDNRTVANIAVLVIDKPVILSERVQPACIDLHNLFEESQDSGLVTGWFWNDGPPNDRLIKGEYIKIAPNSECETTPTSTTIHNGTICLLIGEAGFEDPFGGNGLVFKNPHDGKFYVTALNTKSGSFIRISNYFKWFILDILLSHRPARTGICKLPESFENGKWQILGSNVSTLEAKQNTVLSFKCDDGYILSGTELNLCEDGAWQDKIPSCLRACPLLNTTKTSSCVKKINDVWEPKDCRKATDGTIATIQCDSKIATSKNGSIYYNQAFSICFDGAWSPFDCNQKCGKGEDYPWKVSLTYHFDSYPICGGVVLNERTILTAAHCIDDHVLSLYHAQSLANPESAGVSIHFVRSFIPKVYKKNRSNYQGDIAVLITKESLIFTEKVQPACLDFYNLFEGSQHEGLVVNWKRFKNKLITVQSIPRDECLLNKGPSLINVKDKICVNTTSKGENTICTADGGCGLVFKNPENDRFYLTGLASVGLGECDGSLSGFVRLSDYLKWFVMEAALSSTHPTMNQ